MLKKYVIKSFNKNFTFMKVQGNKTFPENYQNFKKIIHKFIHHKYTLSCNNEVIILKRKTNFKKDTLLLAIVFHKNLLKIKDLKPLFKDIQRKKNSYGYTKIILSPSGNKRYVKVEPEKKTLIFFPLLKKHAVSISALSLILVFLLSYSLFSYIINKNKPNYNNALNKVFAINTYLSQDFPFINNSLSLASLPSLNPAEEKEEVNEYDLYLEEYASYYHLDSEKVIDFAKEVTDNYTLSFTDINGTNAYDTSSKEADALIFVTQLYNNKLSKSLASYNLSINDFVLDNDVVYLPSDRILSNGLTFEQFLGKVCDLLQIDKAWILGITYFETGRLTSTMANYKNNFGGLRGNGDFYTFITPEAGIIAHCRNLKRYENFGLKNLYELAGIYVYGNINLIYNIYESPEDATLNSYLSSMNIWINGIKSFHDTFVQNNDEIFSI